MTASTTASVATKSAPVATSLAPALSDLREAALQYAVAKASRKVEDWADDLSDFVAGGGPTTQAVAGGLDKGPLGVPDANGTMGEKDR